MLRNTTYEKSVPFKKAYKPTSIIKKKNSIMESSNSFNNSVNNLTHNANNHITSNIHQNRNKSGYPSKISSIAPLNKKQVIPYIKSNISKSITRQNSKQKEEEASKDKFKFPQNIIPKKNEKLTHSLIKLDSQPGSMNMNISNNNVKSSARVESSSNRSGSGLNNSFIIGKEYNSNVKNAYSKYRNNSISKFETSMNEINSTKGGFLNNTNASINININNFSQKNYHGQDSVIKSSFINNWENIDGPEMQHFMNVELMKHNRKLAKFFDFAQNETDDKVVFSDNS